MNNLLQHELIPTILETISGKKHPTNDNFEWADMQGKTEQNQAKPSTTRKKLHPGGD